MTRAPLVEEELIGAILLRPRSWFVAAETVAPEDFSHPVTAELFRAVGAVARRGTVTPGLVVAEARAATDGVPLDGYLYALMGMDPDIGVEEHAAIIADASRDRRAKAAVESMAGLLQERDLTTDELIAKAMEALQGASATARDRYSVGLDELVGRVAGDLASLPPEGAAAGVSTGLSSIDGLIGPLLPGELIVIGGDSGSGKTALATQIGIHVAASAPVEMCELEMDALQVAQRQLAGLTGISSRKIRAGTLTMEERESLLEQAQRMRGLRFTLHTRPGMTVDDIRAKAMARRGRDGELGLVIVDHSKLVKIKGKTVDRMERIARVYEEMKDLAKEAQVPVILLSQLTRKSREGAQTAKRISDLRPSRDGLYGGGDTVEFADIVLLVHQPSALWERAKPRKDGEEMDAWANVAAKWHGRGEVIVDKHRGGQSGGIAELEWDGPACRYKDIDIGYQDTEELPL